MKKITLTFSTLQFIMLLKLIYLGNWMANAFRVGEDVREDYVALEQLVYTLAQEAGFTSYVYPHDSCKKLHTTEEFLTDTGVDAVRAEYDEDVFWDELIQRLAKRDIEESVGVDTVKNMKDEEYQKHIKPYLDRWTAEVNRFGIERLRISHTAPPTYTKHGQFN
jgi:hypothetical protein